MKTIFLSDGKHQKINLNMLIKKMIPNIDLESFNTLEIGKEVEQTFGSLLIVTNKINLGDDDD